MKQKIVDILARQKTEAALEFIPLDKKVKDFAPTKDRHEHLRKKFQAWYEGFPADKPFSIATPLGSVIIGERSMERTITDMAGLATYLKTRFMKLCTFRLSDLDSYVPEPARAKFVTSEQTGSRKVTVEPAREDIAKAA